MTEGSHPGLPRISIRVNRLTLAKRRWRALAGDGRDLGFILEKPLRDGELVLVESGAAYFIEQLPESVIEVAFRTPAEAARVGWAIGNLHFPVEIREESLFAPDDPAVRQLLEREGIDGRMGCRVFRPLRAGAHEPHRHDHRH